MGKGWRRAFCTTIPRDEESTPKSSNQLGIFSSISNPSTPRLCRRYTFPDNQPAPAPAPANNNDIGTSSKKLHCNIKSDKSKPMFCSNPSSPRSSPFSIFKNTLRFSKNGCGVCTESVKTGQGMAIYTAECSHAFHFPCIASHVRKQGTLICPVCNVTWKDVPLLSLHKNISSSSEYSSDEIIEKKTITSTSTSPVAAAVAAASAPATPTGTNRIQFEDKRIQSSIKSVKTKPSSERIRAYNDDEPLLSPTSGGGRFNLIPESEELTTEDSFEFQGFFVTPPDPPTPKMKIVDPFGSIDNNKTSRNVEVKLLPEAAVVSASRSYETYAVALRVKAPPSAAAILCPDHRAPIDLVTVLDVSGSMTGAKLHMLKRAMRLVISSLGPADRLAIVAFSATSKRLFPLRRMTGSGQKAARQIIDQLVCSQGTSVSDALRKAARVLEDRREKNSVASIMLLSDGQDDRVHGGGGNSNPRQTLSHVSKNSTRFSHIEIPVHSSGFGIRTPEPTEDEFTKCVGGLLSVVVQDLRIQLGFSSGSAPAEIVAVYSCNARPSLMSSDSVRLGDLYAEEERELLIELRMPTSAIGSHHVMSVRSSYKDPVTKEVMYGRERALLVPRPHAVRSSDPKIERLRNLFTYTRAVAESRRLVDHGDFSSAHHLLSSARALVMQSAAEDYVAGLEAELAQVHWQRNYQVQLQQQEEAATVAQHVVRRVDHQLPLVDENGEPLTPTSAWRAAERLAKVAMMKKSLNRSVSDLHGFENARF